MSEGRSLRAVFMGTSSFAIPVLAALMDAGCSPISVYTKPDKRSGRGRSLIFSDIKNFAVKHGLTVFQPDSLRENARVRDELVSLDPDIIVVAAYGVFLPREILCVPRLGCLNVHPSLLPRLRGPSPVAGAILKGDVTTGVSIMLMDEGMDTGPVVAQQETTIRPEESADQLSARLFDMGANLLMEILPQWELGEIQAVIQDNTQATVSSRLNKNNGEIDWSIDACHIARQVRAYYPWPGSFTYWGNRRLKVIEACVSGLEKDPSLEPGRVGFLSDGVVGVGTGHGVLEIRRVQIEGRHVIRTQEFVSGHCNFLGATLGEQ